MDAVVGQHLDLAVAGDDGHWQAIGMVLAAASVSMIAAT